MRFGSGFELIIRIKTDLDPQHCNLKGVCHEIFYPYFFMIRTQILAPDKQPKVFFEFGFDFAEIFDHKVISAVCNIRQR